MQRPLMDLGAGLRRIGHAKRLDNPSVVMIPGSQHAGIGCSAWYQLPRELHNPDRHWVAARSGSVRHSRYVLGRGRSRQEGRVPAHRARMASFDHLEDQSGSGSV